MKTVPAVLFVCLGNICRSPLAEAALRKVAAEASLPVTVDSAGTAAYHVGSAPDPRSIAEARRHGIDISHLRGRQIEQTDFNRFDWIIGMDRSNMRNILHVRPTCSTAQIVMLMDLVIGREGTEVTDPWYGGKDNFVDTWNDVMIGAKTLTQRLL